jgi:hypothetical protein
MPTDTALTARLSLAGRPLTLSLDAGRYHGELAAADSPLDVAAVLRSILGDVSLPTEVVPALQLSRLDVEVAPARQMDITATVDGLDVRVFAGTPDGKQRASGVVLSRTTPLMSLAELPLIGNLVRNSPLAAVGIEALGFVHTSGAGTYTVDPKQPDVTLDSGLWLVAALEVDGKPSLWAFPLRTAPADSAAPAAAKSAEPADKPAKPAEPAAPPTVSPTAAVTWKDVHKAFGPVGVDKIGFGYADGQASFSVSASLALAGIELDLQGLSMRTALTKLDPSFGLDGLGLDFARGPLAIGGAFLRTSVGKDEYYLGEAIARTDAFALSAFGGYAPAADSFFLFAHLDRQLGGPPSFRVVGLSAGFGLNSRLAIPRVDQLATFPLLPAHNAFPPHPDATKPHESLTGALASIAGKVTPAPGQTWLAAGIDFTSFEVVRSSALLTASFGANLEIALLGLSQISLPRGASPPLAFAEIALEASFHSDSGLVAIDGLLTPASYLYSGDCHLTGGFAFYSWTGGDRAGDFVVTLGGYHPRFDAAGYPAVPRLALTWQHSPELAIKGEAYFALTGHALMAGGLLDAVWASGDLSAWFKASADFLVTWQPFFYSIDVGVEIGASVTIHFFGAPHLTVDLSADLHLEGPPFSGHARIHIWIASFSVEFGASAPAPTPIDWPTFRSSCLPPAPQPILTATPTSGLVKTVPPSDGAAGGDWVFNAPRFALTITSAIPITSCNLAGVSGSPVGIAPMAVREGQFKSELEVVVSHDVDGDVTAKHLTAAPVEKRVPVGLWGDSFTPALDGGGESSTVQRVVGVVLTPRDPEASDVISIDRDKLGFELEWAAPKEPPGWEKTEWASALADGAPRVTPADTADRTAVLTALIGADQASRLSTFGPAQARDLRANPILAAGSSDVGG